MKYIRENSEQLKKAIRDKNINLNIDELFQVDDKRRALIKQIDDLRHRRNEISESLKTKRLESLISEGKVIKQQLNDLEEELLKIQNIFDDLYARVPNIPSPDSPIGADETGNVEIFKWGEIPKFDFAPLDHITLCTKLGLIDFDSGVHVSGFRGYYLKNEAALMHWGLMWLGIRKMIKHGFTLHVPPTLLKSFALYGSGYFPFGKEEIYKIGNTGKEDFYLAGTSEQALLGMHQDAIFEEKDLPLRLSALSQCYRSEIGSYGKDTKGIYRVHEFLKVEQVVICRADLEESTEWFEKMRAIAEEILVELGLPYRILLMCTGDMGAGKYKMYDIETWMPSRKSYGETHSNSNLTDWQARRLNIRYRDRGGELKFVHTLNNTVIASPRILISLLEINQQADGSIKVPKVLQEFVGKDKISR